MPWYRLSGSTPYFSPTPRTDLGPEVPAPGSEPEAAPEEKVTPPKESKKK